MIEMIVAHTPNRVIGSNGHLPWKNKNDMAWFKKHTIGKAIVMGHNTFKSIGRPLPKRRNIVVSRTLEMGKTNNIMVARTPPIESNYMIIGGAAIYEYYLPYVSTLYRTILHEEYEGDTYFPVIDESLFNIVFTSVDSGATYQILERKK